MKQHAPTSLVVVVMVAGLLAQPNPAAAADKAGSNAYAGAAVSVIKARKTCFADTISVSGRLVPREEVMIRPEREGLQISQVLVDAGETVTANQVMARLAPPIICC